MKKIAVLSAGNGGQALAADLALRGHDVALYDLPRFAPVIEAIRRRGNTIELQNKITGTATIRLVATDIAEALDGAEVVYFTAPSYGQKTFFDLAVPALSDGQVIVLMPGNYVRWLSRPRCARRGRTYSSRKRTTCPMPVPRRSPAWSTCAGSRRP